MKKLSKRLSLFVCLTIIANLLVFSAPVVLASNSEAEVLYKSSFSDYTKDGSPKGWAKASYLLKSGTEVENTSSYAFAANEKGGHNNILKIDSTSLGNAVADVIPFGKIISSGKLHISYDSKIPQEDTVSSVAVVLFNNHYNTNNQYENDNANAGVYTGYGSYIADDFRGSVGQHQSHLMKVYYSTDGVAAEKKGNVYVTGKNGGQRYGCLTLAENASVTIGEWYHTDLIVDLDNNNYNVWINGTKATDSSQTLLSSDGYNEFKGLGFLQPNGDVMQGLYDNITVTHYAANDKIQMLADAGKEGIGTSAADGKYLNVSFNDSLETDLRDNDFVITAADGSSVSGVKVLNKTKSGCVLDFSAATGLKVNTTYTVTYNASNKGVATEVDAYGASAAFRTNAAAVDTSSNDYKYYYSKEDFNGFTDKNQLPLGFYNNINFDDTATTVPFNKYLTRKTNDSADRYLPANGVGGNALKLSNGADTLFHFFPRGVVAGDFTLEFDVKYSVGAWAIGLIPYRSWENANVQKSDLVTLGNYRYINALIGMSSNSNGTRDNISAPNLAVHNGTGLPQIIMDDDNNVPVGLTIAENTWSHIKLDFDMAEGNFDISVTDKNGTKTVENVSYGDWNKFGSGIEGMVFYKWKSNDTSAEVNFDNLEVYTTSGKLLNEDFNGYKSDSAKRFPYFWTTDTILNTDANGASARSATSVALSAKENAYSVQGKTNTSGDEAVRFTGTSASNNFGLPLWYTARFAKTVPAGQSYAVEFDLKYSGDDTVWVYGPVDSTRVTPLKGYNINTNVADQVMTNTNLFGMAKKNLYSYAKDSQASVDAYNGLFGTTNSDGTYKYYSPLTFDDSQTVNTWRHYKIVAIPQTNNTKYIVTVDNTKYEFEDKLNNNKKDIAGIAFQIRRSSETVADWGVDLDNVSAYLCDESGNEITDARENSILDIEAEKLNGDTVSLMNTNEIPYSTKKIIVTFSENLDETLKKDIAAIDVVNGTRTGTVKGIYDYVEDVIQLRQKYMEYPMDYTAEIDGNKFIITLNDVLSSDTTYSLHIAKNVSFASSPYSTLDNGFSRTYTGVVDPDGGFKLTSCKAVVKSGVSWKEVTSFADITSGEANLGLEFNVTNVTGAAKNIRAVAAFYDENGDLAELVNVGIFDQVIESKADAQTPILEIAMPTLSEGKSYTTVKFFAWDADNSAPLKRPQTFTNVTE